MKTPILILASAFMFGSLWACGSENPGGDQTADDTSAWKKGAGGGHHGWDGGAPWGQGGGHHGFGDHDGGAGWPHGGFGEGGSGGHKCSHSSGSMTTGSMTGGMTTGSMTTGSMTGGMTTGSMTTTGTGDMTGGTGGNTPK
jgi:hypothetical protein